MDLSIHPSISIYLSNGSIHPSLFIYPFKKQVTKESEASQVVNRRRYLNQRISQTYKSKHKRIDEETELTVPLIVKGDVGGSVEALLGIIESAKPHLVRLDVVHTGIGGVSDSDIEMASSVDGMCEYVYMFVSVF